MPLLSNYWISPFGMKFCSSDLNKWKCGNALVMPMKWIKTSLVKCLFVLEGLGKFVSFALLVSTVFNSAPHCITSHSDTHARHTQRHTFKLSQTQNALVPNCGQNRFIGNHRNSSLTCHYALHLAQKQP